MCTYGDRLLFHFILHITTSEILILFPIHMLKKYFELNTVWQIFISIYKDCEIFYYTYTFVENKIFFLYYKINNLKRILIAKNLLIMETFY